MLRQTSIVVTACIVLMSASSAAVWAQGNHRDQHITLEKAAFGTGERIRVQWHGLPGNHGDWITVVPAATPDNSYRTWWYARSYQDRTHTIAPLAAGRYEVRVYFDWPKGGYTVQSRLAFTVGDAPTTATPGPRDLEAYRNRVGQTVRFQVTGTTTGGVYGTGVYADDSHLSTAAVHAGVLRAGQSGVVTVEILRGRDSYTGSTANGVTSRNWSRWGGSYRFVGTAGAATPTPTPTPGTGLVRLEGKVLSPRSGVNVYVGTGFNPRLTAGPILEYNTIAARVTPDRDGNWVANVPRGTYDVYIISRGYVSQTWRVQAAPGRVPDTSLGRGSGAHNNSLTLRQRAR